MSNSLAQSLARKLNTTTTLSMESVDVDVNIGQDAIVDEDGAALSPLAPATDEPIVEAQQTELVEEESEMDSTDLEDEAAESDIETLESIQLHLAKSLEHGGLDSVSFEMFGLTMDHIYRKYGIASQDVLPSMESFNNDALGQTTVSMEKVRDTMRSVKEGAVQLIKKLWFQLKEFLKGLFTFNLTAKKRASALIKAARELNDDTARPEIKLFNAQYLLIDGKVPEKSALINGYQEVAQSSTEITKTLSAQTKAYGQLVNHALRTKSDDKSEETLASEADVIINYAEKLVSTSNKLVFSNAHFEAVKFGVGEGKSLLAGTKLIVDKAPKRGGDSEGYKVKPLTCSEIQKLARMVEGMCDTLTTFDKSYDKKVMENIVVKELPMLEEDKDGKVKEFKVSRQIKKGIKSELNLQRKYLSFIGKVNKAALDYCAQSLSAIKKDAPKKDDK